MPHHKHYPLIQKWVQDPESYKVFARKPEGKPLWLEVVDPMWSVRLEYKLEPKQPCAFLWHIITDPWGLQIVSQVVTRRDLEALEFVQELYPDCKVKQCLDKPSHYEVVGLCHIQICNSVPLKSDQLAVLVDLNICSL